MTTPYSAKSPWGYRWRSSTPFVLTCVAIALFTESFLYAFIIPILPYILETRNHVKPSDIQRLTYQYLTVCGASAIACALFIGELFDRFRSRKLPLVLSMGIALMGTLLVASSTQMCWMYVGGVLQGIGGTGAWVIGLSTLRDSIDSEDIGKAFGLVHGLSSAGGLAGPAIAGVLLELTGYWTTWASAMSILALDIILRLFMLEKQKTLVSNTNNNEEWRADAGLQAAGEETSLISDAPLPQYSSTAKGYTSQNVELSRLSFYRVIFSQRRVLIGFACSIISSAVLASYSTTIPTHVKFAFDWGSMPTGLLFATLEGPTIIMGPVCGWLRDRTGTRLPATLGFVLLATFVWLLGAADQVQFPWATTRDYAKHTYILAIIGIGFVTNLTAGVCTIEMTCTVDELEIKQPGIFGPNGGYSRCYSLTNLSFAVGLLLGPIVSGILADSLGYFHMNSILCCTLIVMAITTGRFLEGKTAINRRRDDIKD